MNGGHEMRARTRDGREVELVLFKFDGCPYCGRVLDYLAGHPVPVRLRDTRQDAGAAEELLSIGGKNQVPCLVVDGRPLYESLDIIHYLEREFC